MSLYVYYSTSASLPPVIYARSSSYFLPPSGFWLSSASFRFWKLFVKACLSSASNISTNVSILIATWPITKNNYAKWMSVMSCLNGIIWIVETSSGAIIYICSISSAPRGLNIFWVTWLMKYRDYSWHILDFKLKRQLRIASQTQNHSRSYVPKLAAHLDSKVDRFLRSRSVIAVSQKPPVDVLI